MSVSNIFDCCKKTEILLGISGIILGTYATNAFLKSPLIGKEIKTIKVINAPVNATKPSATRTTYDIPIKVSDEKIAVPIITTPINPIITTPNVEGVLNENIISPVDIPIILSEPINYFNVFMNSANVIINGGLAYITIGNGIIIAISSAVFYTLKIVLNRMFRRMAFVNNYANRLGEGSFIGRMIKKTYLNVDKYRNISDTQTPPSQPPEEIEINVKDKMQELKKMRKIKKKGDIRYKPVDDYRNRRKKIIIEQGKDIEPPPFFIFGNKLGGAIYFYDDPIKKTEENIIIENKEDEKEEIDDSIKKIEEDDKIIDEIVNTTEVYIDMELYNIFVEEMRTIIENSLIIEIPNNIIDDLFNRFNIPFQNNIIDNFSDEINFNPNNRINNFERLYQISYNDLQEFLKYGNKMVEGDIEVNGTGNMITVNTNKLKIVKKTDDEITVNILNFEKNTYPWKILNFYRKYLLPLLAVLKTVGISKYSIKIEELFGFVLELSKSTEAIKNKEVVLNIIPGLQPKLKKDSENEFAINVIKKAFKASFKNYNEKNMQSLVEIDELFFNINLKITSIQVILKIVRKLFLNLQNK